MYKFRTVTYYTRYFCLWQFTKGCAHHQRKATLEKVVPRSGIGSRACASGIYLHLLEEKCQMLVRSTYNLMQKVNAASHRTKRNEETVRRIWIAGVKIIWTTMSPTNAMPGYVWDGDCISWNKCWIERNSDNYIQPHWIKNAHRGYF